MEQLHNPEPRRPGVYGYVLVFKDDLAAAYALAVAEQPISSDGQPDRAAAFVTERLHLTLYHGPLMDDPCSDPQVLEALLLLRALFGSLPDGAEVSLNDLVIFGDKFLFWSVDPSSSTYPLLRAAHALATLALYPHLDREAMRSATKEQLTLTPRQQLYRDVFGHPLVGSEALPHVTLAWDDRGIRRHGVLRTRNIGCTLRVKEVHLAEIGEYGAIKQIIL